MLNRSTGPGINSNIDQVCGKPLSERDPQRSTTLEGQILFFCSRECKQLFDANVQEWTLRMESVGIQV